MTDHEKDAPEIPELRKLPREGRPPAALEDRVAAALGGEGLLAKQPTSTLRFRWPIAIAASVVFFALGLYLGSQLQTAPGPRSEASRLYLLLLREGQLRPADGAGEQERVHEYGEWARQLRVAGVDVRGAKLRDDGMLLMPATDGVSQTPLKGSAETVLGYFLIAAPNLDEAVRVAGQCPHLRHGGAIEVRPIDPT